MSHLFIFIRDNIDIYLDISNLKGTLKLGSDGESRNEMMLSTVETWNLGQSNPWNEAPDINHIMGLRTQGWLHNADC